jgi:Arc/MetJ family transcription regulator
MERFVVSVDPGLFREAMRLTGKKRKSKVIELALRALVRQYRLAELRELVGSGLVNWTPEELSSWRKIANERVSQARQQGVLWDTSLWIRYFQPRGDEKKSKLR